VVNSTSSRVKAVVLDIDLAGYYPAMNSGVR
jgi:hypothetical protein